MAPGISLREDDSMTPTDKLRGRLRRLLDEKIPPSGTDADTRFSDEELDDLLEEALTLNGAASQGWIEKAGMYQKEMGEVEETKTGQESYRLTKLKERLEYAFAMAGRYGQLEAEELERQSSGSVILGIQPPEVL